MNQPMTGYHFRVNWGKTPIQFKEVSGLEIRTDVIEYRTGEDKEYTPRKMPGMIHYGNIRLTRGVMPADNEFFEWWNTLKMNKIDRRDMTISLLNEEHDPVMVWKIARAFPVSLKWDRLEASENRIFLEHLEVATERITVQND